METKETKQMAGIETGGSLLPYGTDTGRTKETAYPP